ncbi:hypothetical protein HanRHA438_Chr10g0461571 [Helianthus annuus]|nr:hypothetical protein HanRHA438_Chr10g0461571 [Helianthus annuus]
MPLTTERPVFAIVHSSMQHEDLERTIKFGSEKVCLGSSFAEHKRNFYHFKSRFLSKKRNEKTLNLTTRKKKSCNLQLFFL